MQKMLGFSDWMIKAASGRLTLLSAVVFMVFMVWVLPAQSAAAASYSAGTGSVDMRLTYSLEDVYRIAEAYGEEGRRAYIQARLTFDVVWPLAYASFLALATSWLTVRSGPQHGWLRRLNLLAPGGMFFDYLENVSVSIVMASFPNRLDALAQLAALFTGVKWLLVGAAFAAVGLAAGFWAAARLRRGKSTVDDRT